MTPAGKGVPGAIATASLGRSSAIATGADGSIYAIDANLDRLLRIKDGKVTVAYAQRVATSAGSP